MMKIVTLRKKIILNFSLVFVIICACGVVFFFYLKEQDKVTQKLRSLENESIQIRNNILELESQAAEIEKYKSSWATLNEGRKDTNGIKIDEFNEKIKELSKKHLITTKDVKINLPEVIKDGEFSRSTIEILFTKVSINFNSPNDTIAIAFVADFISSLNGYPVITFFELKKDKSYSAQDLNDLSLGKNPGLVDGKIEFLWYVSKESNKAKN